jgi:hypothetical protein
MRLAALLLSLLPTLALAQDWTDRAEYDLALAVREQASPAARLSLLDQWKQKYPNSPVKQQRSELVLQTAQSLGDKTRMLEAARELVAGDQNHFAGNYWLTLLSATPAEAETAAKRLLKSADLAGPKQKTEVLAAAHRTLGWVELQRDNMEAAEKEFHACLGVAPRNAEVSGWLGSLLATQNTPAKQVQGIWHLARASYLDGEGALTANQRRDVRDLLEAAYKTYHGAIDGLDTIGAAAAAGETVQPPAGFNIETAAEVAQRKADEEMKAANPQLFEWVLIRRRITGPDGQAEYEKLAQGTMPLLKGYVIRCDKDPKPTEAILGLQDSSMEEIVLKFETPMPRCAEVGVAVEFEGKPIALTREPFRLTVSVAASSLQGWPEKK